MVWRGDRTARLAPCLALLLDEIEERAPGRNKRSDGTIGDRAHQSRESDHNPNSNGDVTALDITDDEGDLEADVVYDRDDFDPDVFFDQLIARRDPRVKYLISDGRICASYHRDHRPAWTWGVYRGSNPHRQHGHLSVPAHQVDTLTTWFPDHTPTPTRPAEPPAEEDDMADTAYVELIRAEYRTSRGRNYDPAVLDPGGWTYWMEQLAACRTHQERAALLGNVRAAEEFEQARRKS